MDERLRELERRWQATGDPGDEGRWLAARVQCGRLSPSALEVAAWLGHPGAVAAAPEAAESPGGADPQAALAAWTAELDRRLAPLPAASHRAVLAEAERLLERLEDLPPALQLLGLTGPQTGEAIAIAPGVGLRRVGARLTAGPPGAGDLARVEAAGGALALRGSRARPGLTVNGRSLTPGTTSPIVTGDTVGLGEARFVCLESRPDDETVGRVRRRVRRGLDEATAALASGTAFDPLVLASLSEPVDGSICPEVWWLQEKLPLLARRITRQAPMPLSWSWPPSALDWWGAERLSAWPVELRAGLRRALAPWVLGREDPLSSRAARALDRLEIASPCPLIWDALEGEGRVRHCGQCEQAVYDLTSLDRGQALALLRAHEGERLCVRLYRRPDGGIMTRDCPTEPAPRLTELLGRVAPDRGD